MDMSLTTFLQFIAAAFGFIYAIEGSIWLGDKIGAWLEKRRRARAERIVAQWRSRDECLRQVRALQEQARQTPYYQQHAADVQRAQLENAAKEAV